ncbi:Apolipoprotein N-acyltransferase [Gammaproteobacteria bacterium]
MSKKKTLLSLIALFAGAILPLAFAPFGYYLIAEIALVLLLLTWSTVTSPRVAFWYGWLFGLAFFGCGVYWVYISIHHFGHAPIPLAVLILAVMIAFLALYPALQGYLLSRIFPQNNWHKFLVAFPATWVILEWLRGWVLSGFPWLFLGYGHIDSPLRGWATIFGVYGVSFVIAQTAGAMACLFFYRKKMKSIATLVLLILVLWSMGIAFTKINWTKKIDAPIKVSLIQGNISLDQKWDKTELLPILNAYTALTAHNFSSKIIIWPEAAIPFLSEDVQFYLKLLSKTAKKHNITILSGTTFYDKENESCFNGILAFGANEGHYHKRHLVPFGEYLPMRFMLSWLHNYLMIPMSGFESGAKNQSDLLIGKTPLAPFVCYEIAYANLVLDYLPRAGLLVTVSDDSWFGESIAAAQHLEIARMRSLEVGRYQLLATNTGITTIIDSSGKIISKLPIFKQAVLTANIQLLSGTTPWVKYGQHIWLLLLLLFLCIAQRKKASKLLQTRFN